MAILWGFFNRQKKVDVSGLAKDELVAVLEDREKGIFVRGEIFVRESILKKLVSVAETLNKRDHSKLLVLRGWENNPEYASGGRVDVCICDTMGQPITMGSHYGDKNDLQAHTSAQMISLGERAARRLLLWAMTEQGFVNDRIYWWKYHFGDYFWSQRVEGDRCYKEIFHHLV